MSLLENSIIIKKNLKPETRKEKRKKQREKKQESSGVGQVKRQPKSAEVITVRPVFPYLGFR
jgi:hypothetical protein